MNANGRLPRMSELSQPENEAIYYEQDTRIQRNNAGVTYPNLYLDLCCSGVPELFLHLGCGQCYGLFGSSLSTIDVILDLAH